MDAPLRQPVQVAQGVPGEPVVHHGAAQLGVHGVHRHVDGADVHLEDAVHLPVVDVGQRDVVAKQEGEPVVVVFKVQRLPHAGGQLVDKAEYALVPAGALLVHKVRLKLQAQLGVLGLDQLHLVALPAPPQGEPQLPLGFEKAVVQHIDDFVAVDGHQHVPRLDAHPLGAAFFGYAVDCYSHLPCLLFRQLLAKSAGKNKEGSALPAFPSRLCKI